MLKKRKEKKRKEKKSNKECEKYFLIEEELEAIVKHQIK